MLILAVFTIAFMTSCNKDKVLEQESYSKSSTARLNTELNNEDMEADINEFIDKLENPSTSADMNYEEAFEYIEATLNYKYVNYDYSKCANTSEFTGEISISVDADNNMTMAAIKTAYDSILNDWHNKYYSISETEKTPIVFDITEVTNTSVSYTMVVGYGYIDLSLWGDNYVVPTNSIYFMAAATAMTNGMNAQINNNQIQRCPSGSRVYYVVLGSKFIKAPQNYPSGTDDISLPGTDGYTDYRFFFSSKDPAYNNPHFYLSTTSAFNEYGFYKDQYGQYITDYAFNNGGNRVSFQNIYGVAFKDQYNSDYTGYHNCYFYYGKEYYTITSLSTL